VETTTFKDAATYIAPKHNGCVAFRLQGLEATSTKGFWVGLSHFLPGGGAESDASAFEKVYIVIAGEITVVAGGKTAVLGVNDSCVIPANETREVRNDSHQPASMIVVISRTSEST
jgi:mannose-6-phosphate isomerase-like protein (cupin superfamily)